jgi:hypothetical protein
VRLEADGVDAAIDLGDAEDLLDLVLGLTLGHVDRLTAERPRLLEALGDQVADDDDRCAEELRGVRGRQADRAGAGDVDRRARLHAGRVGAVEPGREDVRQHRQVEDLLHRLILVGELQEVPVGVRDHDVLGLAADPTAHVHVPVGGARPIGVRVQADARLALLAVTTAPTGDVEGHRDEVTDLDELDVAPGLDHLAGDLVTEDQVPGRGRAAADHVLVGAADVGRDDLQDHPVLAAPPDVVGMHPRPVLEHELWEVDRLDLNLARAEVGDPSVVSHADLRSLGQMIGRRPGGARPLARLLHPNLPPAQDRRKQECR